jgi:hypothetical protein
VDRDDLPALLLARAFQDRGEPTRTCERIEEAEIGAFELPVERAEAGEPRAPNQRVSERAPGLMLTIWPLERIPRKIKI